MSEKQKDIEELKFEFEIYNCCYSNGKEHKWGTNYDLIKLRHIGL